MLVPAGFRALSDIGPGANAPAGCMISRDANCGSLGTPVIESIELDPKPAP